MPASYELQRTTHNIKWRATRGTSHTGYENRRLLAPGERLGLGGGGAEEGEEPVCVTSSKSYKLQATSCKYKLYATSCKLQATSYKLQAPSYKSQEGEEGPTEQAVPRAREPPLRPVAGPASCESHATRHASQNTRHASHVARHESQVAITRRTDACSRFASQCSAKVACSLKLVTCSL